VADDIYEYFSGNGGTREVEPIEEDSGEFEQGLGQDKKAEEASVTPVADPDDLFAAFPGNKPADSADKKSKPKKEKSSQAKSTEPAAKKEMQTLLSHRRLLRNLRPQKKPKRKVVAIGIS